MGPRATPPPQRSRKSVSDIEGCVLNRITSNVRPTAQRAGQAMVLMRGTPRALVMTICTTSNFWHALMLFLKARIIRKPSEKTRIALRSGAVMDLTWPEYVIVRDLLSNGYRVRQVDRLLCVEKGRIKIVGPVQLVRIVNEDPSDVYKCDCENRVVLDVGAFIGDTAVFFSAWGAKKIIIYEPVVYFHEFIRMNIALNGFEAELHEEGIGNEDGYRIIHYDTADCIFGLEDKGEQEMRISIRSARDVIEESGADVAKFDCEGAEESLIHLPDEVLRRIRYYMIETHTREVKRALLRKFQSAGFRLVRDLCGGPECSTIHLEKRDPFSSHKMLSSQQPRALSPGYGSISPASSCLTFSSCFQLLRVSVSRESIIQHH